MADSIFPGLEEPIVGSRRSGLLLLNDISKNLADSLSSRTVETVMNSRDGLSWRNKVMLYFGELLGALRYAQIVGNITPEAFIRIKEAVIRDVNVEIAKAVIG